VDGENYISRSFIICNHTQILSELSNEGVSDGQSMYNGLGVKPERKRHSEDLKVNDRITLKWFIKT
jgi:hypothetical protein